MNQHNDDEGLCVTSVQGPMPPAAVHGLARRLAARIDEGLDAPLCASRVVLTVDGRVRLKSGRVSRRWRAPELRSDDDDGMARTAAGDRWALGRMLLELAVGGRVPDAVVDDATVERIQGIKDVNRRPLPASLVIVIAELLERNPHGRAWVDASENAVDVEDRALCRFVVAQRQPQRRPQGLQRRVEVDGPLERLTREITGGFSLKGLETERTGDMPAGAILGRDDLARLGMARLPTQTLTMRPRSLPQRRPTPPIPFDDVEVTVPTEISALMAPPPTWIATVSIEPPPASQPKTTTTTTTTSPSAKTTTRETSPAAQTTKSAKTRTASKKKWPRALLAMATLLLALLGAAVGVQTTEKLTTPAKPLIFDH